MRRRGALVAAVVAAATCAVHGCGVESLVGTMPADGGASGPGPATDGSTTHGDGSTVRGGDAATPDAGDGEAGPCTGCSSTCFADCPSCSGSDRWCISAKSCSGDCGNCGVNDHYCNVCLPDAGGAPRRVCSAEGPTGICAMTSYPHCTCTNESQCGSRQVCAGGLCLLCGEQGSDGFRCNGCNTCTASAGDCHC
jgi:hypothetical protein